MMSFVWIAYFNLKNKKKVNGIFRLPFLRKQIYQVLQILSSNFLSVFMEFCNQLLITCVCFYLWCALPSTLFIPAVWVVAQMSGFFCNFCKTTKETNFWKRCFQSVKRRKYHIIGKKSEIYRCKIRAFLPITANSDRVCAKQQKKRCRIAMIQHRR